MTAELADWRPNEGPQETFLQSPAFEALYGGAAGGGKSDALLAEAIRQIGNPVYRAVILRRTYPELEAQGSIIDRSQTLYRIYSTDYLRQQHVWRFESGASVGFGHMQREDDRFQYQGAQFAFVGFDELTHFTRTQYLYLFSRCRAPAEADLRCYVRAATNPGGVGHEWVKKRWAVWLDKEHPNPAKPGELRWYAMLEGQDTEVSRDHPEARSRTFIGARVSDNPYLAGTDYERNLQALPLVERARLLDGDWDIMPGAGLVFQREWFPIVDAAPAEARRVRFWDLAATEKKAAKDDPDYTAGARMSVADGVYYIEHMIRMRGKWGDVKPMLRQTAIADGLVTQIGVEREPGASGKALGEEIVRHLAGYSVVVEPPQGDKLARAYPWSAQAMVGNVKLVKGPWNEPFLDECQWFPEGGHDDQVDSVSGAFQMLVTSHLQLW